MKLYELINFSKDKCLENNLEIEAVKKLLIELKYQSAANFILNYNEEIEEEFVLKVKKYLIEKVPIQYILGYTDFFGMKMKVRKNVLIPRFDTEVLVEEAIKEIKNNHYINCLDLCTGSGAIALAIRKNVSLDMWGSDISIDALELAKENNEGLGLDVKFINSDILENIEHQFDIIVSNPPYIGYNDYVEEIVYKNEPHLALFAKNDGLYFYETILKQISLKQKNVKMIIFEIGCNQARRIIEIGNNIFNECSYEVIKDYANLDRVLKITFKK